MCRYCDRNPELLQSLCIDRRLTDMKIWETHEGIQVTFQGRDREIVGHVVLRCPGDGVRAKLKSTSSRRYFHG